MKILIVDDNPANLKLLRVFLESEGFATAQARDGIEALETLGKGPVDAIVSDILMPRLDGYRLCQEVRRNERLRDIPFIFLTATYTSEADEKLCHDVGGDKYLKKPLSLPALLSVLRESIESARGQPRAFPPELPEAEVMKEYSERLVCKLEERNQELEEARAELQKINRELDARVRQRTVELQKANEELEAFAHSVSHDLRAPLTHIKGFVDILLRNCADKLDETDLRYLRIVHSASVRMRELIDALLELSAISQSEMHPRPTDLSALAAEAAANLQEGDPDRVINVEIAPDIIASGDQRLLQAALANLFNNAWKYTRGRENPRIEFGKIAGKDGDAFYVRDNGAGFDMAYVGKLFRPFQRLHSASQFEGAGIGLATVHRIIERHGGKIWAEGVENRGATFYFTLGTNISS